ncbi:carbohydrate ABC transporter permease [Micromonospora sp. NBC_01813]|uniref:carbohydrate ABC transporter permease n=1 Tax=Micromonospora sp. NBC_01813 TaxID=2975988 RepID=UPI002DD7E2F5|nr:sugar ABC transporter permease [Micromonospora sp. NBC_01813]WSA07263.1 sugar ABC transporter permease [Micromonospora sp. NBC_01813]
MSQLTESPPAPPARPAGSGSMPPRRRPLLDWLDRYDRYILPAPAVIVVVAMLAFPIVYTIYLSFHQWSGGLRPPQWIGLDNFTRALTTGQFWGSLWRTAYFVILSVGLQVVIGVGAALLFHRRFPGRGIARTFFMFPMIATPAAVALVWKMMYDPTIGVFNYLVQSIGGPTLLWTSDANLVIPALAIVDTWMWTPLVMLIVLAGLAALPQEPFEAAKVDGAGPIRTFVSVTLPLLRPVLLVAVLFRLIDAIKTFDIIKVITDGGPGQASETLNLYAFKQGLSYLHFGYGSALLVFLTLLVFGVAIVFTHVRARTEEK